MTFVLLLMLFTLLVLVAGIVLMARGGKVNQKYSNALMRARIICQLLAIILLGVLFMMAGK